MTALGSKKIRGSGITLSLIRRGDAFTFYRSNTVKHEEGFGEIGLALQVRADAGHTREGLP